MPIFDLICQIIIPIMSAGTVTFLSRKDSTHKYGYICGLASQPFWLFSTAYHGQWGLFIAAIYFTIRWIIGIRNHYYEGKKS